MVIEKPPLCNGETSDYRRFIKEVITEGATGPRSMTLALISNVSHTFWTSRRVIGVFWFDQANQGSEYPLADGLFLCLMDKLFFYSSRDPWTSISSQNDSTQFTRNYSGC